ncbi:aromatic acid exporter family protein [Clostridium aestuarii]|uniref:Aromatic acid exporter family protein n=1 Tax=Clostridium aestuarii TaxID=338193 RepID=A0ABT4CWF3_9CLOT|nr:aromatic acid exporter family protein [Clostridium aestuarii]MCY6483336.1 aromatic acid exporter family protein [Clostridium aestuarii]
MRKIGMRNLKTSLSVFLCIIILRILNFKYPFYACIAAVICMQSSVFNSFTIGKNRMIGTFIGAVIGFLFALIQPRNVFLCGIGIIVVIYICTSLGRKKSVTIACIVFLAIMTNLIDKTPFIYSIHRLFETFVGIIIAVLVNYFVFPPKYLDNLNTLRKEIIDNIFKLTKEKIYNNSNIDLLTLNKKISNYESLVNSFYEEITYKQNKLCEIDDFKVFLTLSKKAFNHLSIIKALDINCNLTKSNLTNIASIYNIELKQSSYTTTDSTIVYNYHINELVKILDTLKSDILKINISQ